MLPTRLLLNLPAWTREAVDTHKVYADAEARVGLAIDLARRNVANKTGGPFGAAVFTAEGRLVSVGVNSVIRESCSAAHAEIMAYTLAQTRLQRFRLNQGGEKFVLASSAQPCCQCYGATIWAGIDELLIGARSEDVEELTEFDEGPLPADWIGELGRRGVAVTRDVLRAQAREVLAEYGALGGVNY